MKKTSGAIVLLAATASLLPLPSGAQTPPATPQDNRGADWLDTPQAQSFRHRVVALALLYGESGGIDPKGFKIEARVTGERVQGCPVVAAETSIDGTLLRRDTAPVCKP